MVVSCWTSLGCKVFLWLGSYGGGSSVAESVCRLLQLPSSAVSLLSLVEVQSPPCSTPIMASFDIFFFPSHAESSGQPTCPGGLMPGLSLIVCPAFLFALLCRSENSAGEISVSGGTDLKSSQHYPPLFGQAVAELLVAQKAKATL